MRVGGLGGRRRGGHDERSCDEWRGTVGEGSREAELGKLAFGDRRGFGGGWRWRILGVRSAYAVPKEGSSRGSPRSSGSGQIVADMMCAGVSVESLLERVVKRGVRSEARDNRSSCSPRRAPIDDTGSGRRREVGGRRRGW